MEKRIQVNIPYRMLLEKLELVIEKRLNPEIYFNGEALDTCRHQDLVRVSSVLRDHGLGITMHAPFMDLSPGGVDTKIKKATLERLQQMLEVAALFNPQMVTFHPGYNKWFFDGNVDLWLENSLTTWGPLVAQVERMGIPIAVENIFEEEPSSLEKLVAAINSSFFNFCFDTGHFNLFSTVPMEAWFTSLGTSLKAVHLHDNHKTSDDHLPMGEGEIDFELFFQLIKRHQVNPIYIVEPHKVEHVERSIQACRDFLRKV